MPDQEWAAEAGRECCLRLGRAHLGAGHFRGVAADEVIAEAKNSAQYKPKVQYQRQHRVAQIRQRPEGLRTQHQPGVAMNKKGLIVFSCIWSAAPAMLVAATILAARTVMVTTVDAQLNL